MTMSRVYRRAVLPMLAALVALAGLGLAPAAAPEDCRSVPFQGYSCRVPGGWRIMLADGRSVITHGHDPVPGHLGATVPNVTPVPPACVDDPLNEYHGLLVYARAVDRPSRYEQMAPEIRQMVAYANGVLRAEAAEGGRTADYRMLCSAGQAVVADVMLSTPLNRTTFQSILIDLQKLGYASSLAKYWIWLDGHPPGAPGGTGTFESDRRPQVTNPNNYGPSYGVTWGFGLYAGGAWIMMHENGHNLGAVQDAAFNSSGAGHCNDGLDVMCYADGGPRSDYSASRCARVHFDCGHDDYFNANPEDPNPIALWWNLGSPMNRFVRGCLYRTGSLSALPGDGAAIVPLDGCAGRAFSLSGTAVRPPVSSGPDASVLASPPILAEVDVCWRDGGGAELECARATGAETGVIPAGAADGVVVLRQGAPAQFVLSVM